MERCKFCFEVYLDIYFDNMFKLAYEGSKETTSQLLILDAKIEYDPIFAPISQKIRTFFKIFNPF